MKKLFNLLIVFILGALTDSYYVAAQIFSYEQGDPYMIEKIQEQLNPNLADFPATVRRIAIYKINYSALRFTNEEVEYIRAEIEYSMRNYAGLTVLSPPELEPNDKLKIVGNDSTLQILNMQGRSLADVSPEMLEEIAYKYGVQGLVELSLQRREPEGLVISIRVMNPQSREVIWSNSFISNPPIVLPTLNQGTQKLVTFGISNKASDSWYRNKYATSTTSNDTTGTGTGAGAGADSTANAFSHQADTLLRQALTDFSITFTYRQPLDLENSSYIGFSAGYHIVRSQDREQTLFDISLFELGLIYYQAISEKVADIDEYRVVFYSKLNTQFPLGNKEGEMFVLEPGLQFNLSKNIGLSVFGNLMLAGETIKLANKDRLTYKQTGFGFHAVIRF
ncbi:MAG: hypothetical protein CL672_08635 [Balneola sp.]|nr:hypothetical protein [Balneola sp.]